MGTVAKIIYLFFILSNSMLSVEILKSNYFDYNYADSHRRARITEVFLSNLAVGQRAEVISYGNMGFGAAARLRRIGLNIGSQIKLLQRQPFFGPVFVEIDGMIKMAIGRNIADRIVVSVVITED